MRHPRLLLLSAGALLSLACQADPRPARPDSAGAGARPDAARGAPELGPAAPAGGGSGSDTLPIRIDAAVDGRSHRATGLGACTHTTDATIYQAPAAQWHVEYAAPDGNDADPQHLGLTVWQLKAGGTQFTLSLRVGSDSYQIATVRGGEIKGSGRAAVRAKGGGGTLTAEGKTADGTAVRVTAVCERTVEPVAEGG